MLAQSQTDIRPLPAGQTIEREMTSAETHSYKLYLPTEAEILREIQEHQKQLKLTIGDNS